MFWNHLCKLTYQGGILVFSVYKKFVNGVGRLTLVRIEIRHHETTNTKLFWPTHSNSQIHTCSWYLHLSKIGIYPFSQVAPTDTYSLNVSRRELSEKQSKLLFFKQDTSLQSIKTWSRTYLSIDQWQTLRTLPRLCCPLVEFYTSVSRVY